MATTVLYRLSSGGGVKIAVIRLLLCFALAAAPAHAEEIETPYGVAQTFFFELYEPDGVDLASVTCATGDIQVSDDGANYASANACFSEIQSSGTYSWAATASELSTDKLVVRIVDQTATKEWLDDVVIIATRLDRSIVIPFTVDDTVTPTTQVFEASDVTEATSDHYNLRLVCFATGALTGQCRRISDYALVSGRGRFTVPTMSDAPADGDRGVILPHYLEGAWRNDLDRDLHSEREWTQWILFALLLCLGVYAWIRRP